MEYKTEIAELVSEFVLDDILIIGKSGGGKAKSGIIGTRVWRLAGWEFERWRDPSCRLIVGKKNYFFFEIEKWWCGVVL